MRKKKFTGLLMLTAAVALGTVSPAALPNTAVVVKADVSDVTNPSGKYNNIKLDNTTVENETLVLTDGGTGIDTIMGETHYYAFGKDKATALAAAIAAAKGKTADSKVVVVDKKFTTKTVPEDANSLVIVDSTNLTDSSANGVAIDFSSKRENDIVDDTDYTYFDGEGQATVKAGKKLQYRMKDTDAWTDVTGEASGTKFPTVAVAEGEKADCEVRVKASTAEKLPSISKKIEIKHKHKITIDEVKKALTFSVDGKVLKVSGVNDNFKNKSDELRGIIKYKYDAAEGDLDNNSKALEEGQVEADVAADTTKKVFVFVKYHSDNSKVLTISFNKLIKPELEQVGKEYKLKAKGSYVVKDETEKVKYQIKKADAADSEYKDTKVEKEESKNVITFNHLGGDNVNYKVKEVSTETKEIKFGADNGAKYTFDSEASDDITVKEDEAKLDEAKFNKIELATKDNSKKLTITVPEDVKKVKDEVTYGYEGKKNEKLDLAVAKAHELDVMPGKFVLKSADKKLMKTINFVVPGLKSNYSKVDEFVKALGDKATALNTYKITDKSGADVDNLANLKEGEYKVAFRDSTAAVNVEIGETQEYKLATPVKVTIRKNSVSSPVVPSTDNSTATKKDEPKKDETKKPDTKKTDAKKDDAKKTEDNKQSDSTSTTETKQSERVSAKNTKKNTVKVSEEKIEEALETGLKVMAKSGKVEFSAKAVEKMVGNSAEAVTVTLKRTATKSNAKEVTKKLKSSKLVSKKVFALVVKAGGMTVKESQLKGTKIKVTLKVNLKKAPKFVWVMDLSTGKKVKAAYKKGKLTFKTSNLGKFVIVNK